MSPTARLAELERLAVGLEGWATRDLRTDQALVAWIEDNGSAFNPTRVPRPAVPTSLTQAKVGNLGIQLMRSFASSMHYERRDNRNRLTIGFFEESAKDREGK